MKTTRVAEDIFQLTRMKGINAFLVTEEDGCTLVDTMIRGSADDLIAAAAPTGKPIVRVVITHAHDDHYGSLDAVARALPEAEVIVSKRDAMPLRGDSSNQPGEPDGKWLRTPKPIEATIDREVVEGDRSIGSLEVIETPGHSPGQIALLDSRDGTLIAADAYSSLGAVATTAGPDWHFPLPGFVSWDKPLALESAIKLRDLQPSLLLVGHGKPTPNPVPAMTKAIDKKS